MSDYYLEVLCEFVVFGCLLGVEWDLLLCCCLCVGCVYFLVVVLGLVGECVGSWL